MTPLDWSLTGSLLLAIAGLTVTAVTLALRATVARPVSFTITPTQDGAVKVTEGVQPTAASVKVRATYQDPGRVERREMEARRAVEEAAGVQPITHAVLRSSDPMVRDIEVVERFYE